MTTVRVQPHVDPALCIGCGAWEKVYPVQDDPAVYVAHVGETRSKTNVIMLENKSYTGDPKEAGVGPPPFSAMAN